MANKLWNKDFLLLWQGQFVSQLGSQAFAIAMMFWVKHTTGSATLMGTLMMVSMLPSVLVSPFAGTFSDHYSRKKIIVYCDFISGILVLALSYLIFFYDNEVTLIITILFGVSVVLGIIRTFFSPAITASIPDIVPQQRVEAANSLNQSSMQLSMLVGQAIGGILFVKLGAAVLFLIDGISYVFSGVSEMFIKIPQKFPDKSAILKSKWNQFKEDTLEGFHFVWKDKGMRFLFGAAAMLNFFSMPFIVLLPFYVEDFLKVQADWYGYILAGFGFGSLIGYALAGTLKFPPGVKPKVAVLSLVLMAAIMPVFGFVLNHVFALLLIMALGIFNGYFNITVITALQTKVASEIRGRVFGLLTMLTTGLMPISMGLSGVVADLMDQNIPLLFIITGLITFILAILISGNKDMRDFLTPALTSESGDEE
ncbi:MFS transporter [Fulvivirgaceae bacterium BMA10]|uniref:MFS transporter n=1 Tax=Splendidivirga corallicola TaxID=3051826 RepID=A0ABT8KUW1_9BACT|nr:MFS transporter [Fulvivirgaceae bacterium BMA10]